MGLCTGGRGVSLRHEPDASAVLQAPRQTRAELASTAVLGALGAMSIFFLNGWDSFLPLFVVPAIAGACIGACATSKRQALLAGLAAGLAGSIMSMWLYLSIPTPVGRFVVASVYRDGQVWLPCAIAIVLTPILAWAVHLLVAGHAEGSLRRRVVAWSITGVVVLSFLVTMSGPAQHAGRATLEPATGSDYTDNMLNIKTYHFMADGQSFYEAYVGAHAMRGRLPATVRDGKFMGGSAAMFRQPTMFAMWSAVGPDHDFSRVVRLSILLSAALLIATYTGLRVAIGPRALFMASIIFPFFVTQAIGMSMQQPEWWATLAVLGGFLALVGGRPLSAGLLGLVALTFRETSGVWLLAMGVCAVLFAFRNRRAWRWVAIYAGLLAVGIAVYARHVAEASRYVVNGNIGAVVGYLLNAPGSSALQRLAAPVEYLMVAYGSSFMSLLWLVPVGLVGLWIGLRRVPSARLSATLYVFVFCVYFAVLGVLGPYWGQLITPLLIIGMGLAIASADQLMEPDTWLLSLRDSRWGG